MVSTASCMPPHKGKPLAMTSIRRSSPGPCFTTNARCRPFKWAAPCSQDTGSRTCKTAIAKSVLLPSRVQPCAKPDAPRSAHTRNSFALTRAAGWWSLRLRLAGASARKPWTSCSGWRGRVREVCRLVCAAPCRLPLPGAGPPSWPRARAGCTLPAPWPCPPTRPQVSMGRRPWSVTCLLTAGSRLPGAAASGEGCPPAREELASVKTAAKTSRARRRPLKSALKHVEATAEKGARAKKQIDWEAPTRLRERGCARIRQGNMSRARRMLMSAALVPKDEATLAALSNPAGSHFRRRLRRYPIGVSTALQKPHGGVRGIATATPCDPSPGRA